MVFLQAMEMARVYAGHRHPPLGGMNISLGGEGELHDQGGNTTLKPPVGMCCGDAPWTDTPQGVQPPTFSYFLGFLLLFHKIPTFSYFLALEGKISSYFLQFS